MTNANTQNKRKSRLILAALLATIVIITGSIFAFFSDVVNHDTNNTTSTSWTDVVSTEYGAK